MTAGDAQPTPRRRGRRIIAWVGGALGAVIVLAVAGILIWSQVGVMAAESEAVAAVRANPGVTVEDDSDAIVLRPTGNDASAGLVFIPGAKVDPWAYADILADAVAEDGITVVITRPWLNLAFLDPRPLSTFTDRAADVARWTVGGHSLGGVRACQLATDADALLLFGSYCATDLSHEALPVLSISGSEDGLSTPAKIDDARRLLPASTEFVVIDGASHASFGDYGPQAGDGTPTIGDDAMREQITPLVGVFVGGE